MKEYSQQEIEGMALEFAKAESYGKLNMTALWKGFIFGFNKAMKLLNKK